MLRTRNAAGIQSTPARRSAFRRIASAVAGSTLTTSLWRCDGMTPAIRTKSAIATRIAPTLASRNDTLSCLTTFQYAGIRRIPESIGSTGGATEVRSARDRDRFPPRDGNAVAGRQHALEVQRVGGGERERRPRR